MPPQSTGGDVLEEDPGAVFPPREQLINTAVKFLQNPRVRPSSVNHKRKFLKQKGLTDEEIDLAFQKAGAFIEDGMTAGPVVVARPYYEKPSLWIKAKDVANLVALFSIGSYSLYSLWKRYIAPSLFGTRSRNERNYEVLLEAIVKLNQNVSELKDLIKGLQGSQQLSLQKSRQPYEMQEIKNELSSIKALLLNRSQFPTSPAGIPSWQMLGGAESIISDDQDHGRDISNDNSNGNETADSAAAAAARRRKSKSQKSQRKSTTSTSSTSGQPISGTSQSQGIGSVGGAAGVDHGNPVDPEMSISMTLSETGSSVSTPGTTTMRKHPSVESNNSNNGFHSGSSCEVVFVGGKNDTDHSDD